MCVVRWAEKLDVLTSTATQDPEGFLGHPVNAFKLMKRLNTEWGEVEDLVLKDMSDGQYHCNFTHDSFFTVARTHFSILRSLL